MTTKHSFPLLITPTGQDNQFVCVVIGLPEIGIRFELEEGSNFKTLLSSVDGIIEKALEKRRQERQMPDYVSESMTEIFVDSKILSRSIAVCEQCGRSTSHINGERAFCSDACCDAWSKTPGKKFYAWKNIETGAIGTAIAEDKDTLFESAGFGAVDTDKPFRGCLAVEVVFSDDRWIEKESNE